MTKMGSRLEEILRKGVTGFGHAVEALIGQARRAKGSMKTAPAIEPILAIESQLPIAKIRELIMFSVDRVVKPLILNLVDKSAIEMGEGRMLFGQLMKEKGASITVYAGIGGSGGSYPKETRASIIHTIVASPRGLPFEDGFFDFMIANMATPKQGDMLKVVKEIGRVLTFGGHAVLIDFHPFGRFAKRGSIRLRPVESVVRGLEDYYKICGAGGLVVGHVKEAFVDEAVRALFVTPEEKSVFRSIKDTPFLVFLLLSKGRR